MRNSGQWIFFLLLAAVALFSGTLPGLLAFGLWTAVTYICLKAGSQLLIKYDPKFSLPVISFKPKTAQMDVWELSSDLHEAVKQVGRQIQRPGDTLLLLNNRFAHLINAPASAYQDQTIISKRLLFEYYRRYGNLDTRFIRARLDYRSVMTPLTDSESKEFETFLQRY